MRGGAEEVADAQRYPAGEVSDARRGIPRGRYPARDARRYPAREVSDARRGSRRAEVSDARS